MFKTILYSTERCFPGYSPSMLQLKIRMLMRAIRHKNTLRGLFAAPTGSAAHRLLVERPEVLGALVWPYQNARWDAETRIARIEQHCRAIDRLGTPFNFGVDDKLILVDLADTRAGARLVLDQPRWFMREGGLTLNLFIESYRAFSLAFSLRIGNDDRPEIFIGGIQGRNALNSLALYRDLTRDFHGIRPRDLMVDCLRILARRWNVVRIEAVSDGARHQLHPYFGQANFKSGCSYDSIWRDRGGSALKNGNFQLPITMERRDMNEIKPGKRSMYRKRYAFLDNIEAEIGATLGTLKPVRFLDH